MAFCPNCGAQVEDGAPACPNCGTSFAAPQINYAYDPADHTAEFDPKDISDNKVTAMAAYLLGPLGIIIALLAAQHSPYAAFHVRQGLKYLILEALTAIVTVLLCWTFIIPAAGGIFLIILTILEVISFFSVCKGRAVEPPIIRSMGFLK